LAVALEIVNTVPAWPPSTIVVVGPEPTIFKLTLMVSLSVYPAGATMTVSPDKASEMACPIVLHAVDGDRQLFLLLPLLPFTYQVVARAVGAKAKNSAKTSKVPPAPHSARVRTIDVYKRGVYSAITERCRPMKVAIYARVSTDDNGQDPLNQSQKPSEM